MTSHRLLGSCTPKSDVAQRKPRDNFDAITFDWEVKLLSGVYRIYPSVL